MIGFNCFEDCFPEASRKLAACDRDEEAVRCREEVIVKLLSEWPAWAPESKSFPLTPSEFCSSGDLSSKPAQAGHCCPQTHQVGTAPLSDSRSALA